MKHSSKMFSRQCLSPARPSASSTSTCPTVNATARRCPLALMIAIGCCCLLLNTPTIQAFEIGEYSCHPSTRFAKLKDSHSYESIKRYSYIPLEPSDGGDWGSCTTLHLLVKFILIDIESQFLCGSSFSNRQRTGGGTVGVLLSLALAMGCLPGHVAGIACPIRSHGWMARPPSTAPISRSLIGILTFLCRL
ncbi:GL25508 [Drosophila persimilis]|uniref:GL25508 n=1 Tax=Drosophila persimilis TaxID=7234 RepID=B4GJG2_DROPE|nr:GL25508 [Drosophila persimilis]